MKALIILSILFISTAYADPCSNFIAGTVIDTNRVIVENATVQIYDNICANPNLVWQDVTNDFGHYRFNDVKPKTTYKVIAVIPNPEPKETYVYCDENLTCKER